MCGGSVRTEYHWKTIMRNRSAFVSAIFLNNEIINSNTNVLFLAVEKHPYTVCGVRVLSCCCCCWQALSHKPPEACLHVISSRVKLLT